jgi:hypothetical protein
MRKQSLSILVSFIIFALGVVASANPTNAFDNIFKTPTVSDNIFTGQLNDDKTIYYILFHHLEVIKAEAAKAVLEGKTPIDNHALYKSQAKLDDVQTQFLFQTAESCMLEIKPINDEITAVVKKSRDKYPNGELKEGDDIPLPPEELQTLWKQKDEVVLKYKDILQNTFGEEKFAEFNKFATDKIAPNIEHNIFKQEVSKDSDNQFDPPLQTGCYGYSLYDVDDNNPARILNMETGTVLYCNMYAYYDPGIQSFLYEDGYLISSLERGFRTSPEIWDYTEEFTGEAGKTYKVRGDHWVRAYYYQVSGGQPYWYDHYGLNYFQGNYPTPYGFTTGQSVSWLHRLYKAASTEISYTVPRPPPHLDSIDISGFPTGDGQVTYLRGTALAGNNRSVQVSGSGVTARLNPQQSPTDGTILDVTFDVAQNAQRGERQLTVTVEGVVSNALTITIGDNSPQITGMTPPQANAGETVAVTISGNHFGVNPQIQIIGTDVVSAITSATTTEITALFSVADATTAGQRGVRVKSLGYTGTGFRQVPGTSDLSNITDFTVTAVPQVTISQAQSVFDGSDANFTATVVGGTSANFEWSFKAEKYLGSSIGNNPQVVFTTTNTTSSSSTIAKGKWFASPNEPCTQSLSKYTIKVKAIFPNGSRTVTTTLNVNAYWDPGGSVDYPQTNGEPEIENTSDGWKVKGKGSLEKSLSPIVMNVPQNSQFYSKLYQHEQVHVMQWTSGIWSNLFNIRDLIPRLLAIEPQKRDTWLRDRITNAKNIWRAEETQKLLSIPPGGSSLYTLGEREAYGISDQINPKYIYQLECQPQSAISEQFDFNLFDSFGGKYKYAN